jgi:arylsulfatase A-like enzyme
MAQKMAVTPEEFTHLQNLYDAEIAYLDHTLGQLFKLLQHRNILDDTVIVLLADHGENFGDHGLMYHQFCLYDSLIRIPMIWHYPRLIKESKNVQSLVSIVDVLPSILRFIGLPTENYPYLQGHPLFSDHRSDSPALAPFIIAEYYTHPGALRHFQRMTPDFDRSSFDKGLKCIRTDRHKFIIDSKGHEELYDLVNDDKEQRNILKETPGIASQLRDTLFKNTREFAHDIHATVLAEQDEATRKQLTALGYL